MVSPQSPAESVRFGGPTRHRFARRVSRCSRQARACRATHSRGPARRRELGSPFELDVVASVKRSPHPPRQPERSRLAPAGQLGSRAPDRPPRLAVPPHGARPVSCWPRGRTCFLFTRASAPSAARRHLLIGKRVSGRQGSTALAQACQALHARSRFRAGDRPKRDSTRRSVEERFGNRHVGHVGERLFALPGEPGSQHGGADWPSGDTL